jgi:PLP dependent protein
MDNISAPTLVLASQSPRRRELLQKAGLVFQVSPIQVSEIPDENLNLTDRIQRLSEEKMSAWLKSEKALISQANLVLTADTLVALDGKTLGKPKDRLEAEQFLTRLSGRSHEVITALSLFDRNTKRLITKHAKTEVWFRKISPVEVKWYISTNEWCDKAGGYGIQGRASRFVSRIEGPYDNVVGLPVELFEAMVGELGMVLPRRSLSVIEQNLVDIYKSIEKACLDCGRMPGHVRLVAVSKTHPIEMVRAAYAFGQVDFGENYVQEALPKIEAFPNAKWHFIGGLQSNKAKNVVGHFDIIHSVDRPSLVSSLVKAARDQSTSQSVMIEVNVADETTKAGVSIPNLPKLVEEIMLHPELKLVGLMAIPPLATDEAAARPMFQKLREEFEKVRASIRDEEKRIEFSELSMGTSSDFVAAIKEGATIIRIGTTIFGARAVV